MKYTKGPWNIIYNGNGALLRPAIIKFGVNMEFEITVLTPYIDPFPDAKLISLAPDLLDTLNVLKKKLSKKGSADKKDLLNTIDSMLIRFTEET